MKAASLRSYASLLFLAFSLWLVSALPVQASPLTDLNTCSTAPDWAVMTRIKTCIENAVLIITQTYIAALIDIMAPFMLSLFVMAVIFFGVRIAYGVQGLTKETIAFMLRFTLVVYFCFEFLGPPINWALVPYQFMNAGISLVTGASFASGAPAGWATSPWENIDRFLLGPLIGYGPGKQLFDGLLGIIGSQLFSGTTGILTFLLGTVAIFATLYFAFRALFSYLGAVVLIAFALVIALFILPFAVFAHTFERYVKKWIDLIIAGVLNPILLTAFLNVFLSVIYMSINSIMLVFGGEPIVSFGRQNNSPFGWLVPMDPFIGDQFEEALGKESAPAAVQNFMNPGLSTSMNIGTLSFPTSDFGPQQVQIQQELAFQFLGLGITLYIMLSLLDGIPSISDSIAGVSTGLKFEEIPFSKQFKEAFSKVKKAASGGAGGGK